VKLLQRGERDFVIFEKAGSIGGTWRDNHYPGLTCDTPAHSYTYSFAPYSEWRANFASGPEIRTYFEQVVVDHGILDHVRLNAEVIACRFDEAAMEWHVEPKDQPPMVADVVIAASGVLHHPKMPDIPGLESFEGRAFHSARWEDDVTVDGARIGVIGGGSTGVQIVSALGGRAEALIHFQRSPQWILPAEYVPYSEDERAGFRADMQQVEAIRNDPQYWAMIQNFTRAITNPDGPEMIAIEEACRRNLEVSVKDHMLREKLRPDYRAACKRLIISWNYYEAVQRSGVEVETGKIHSIVPQGLRMDDGTVHELDVLALATGFFADRFIRPAIVTGRRGATLDAAWAKRPTAYYAIGLPGFPNLFMLNGPTSPVGNFPLIDIAEKQWDYIDQLLDLLRNDQARSIEPSMDAHADYERRRIAAAKTTIFGSGCSSWYLDQEGVPSTWPWTYDDFVEAMRAPVIGDFLLTDTCEASR
jgi:cation diffusion facilitator CzcD-associated flavoprotein CzcO